MPRVPQYQPHQAGPVETTPARLRTTDNSFGIAGGIAAGLPRLAQALQDHGTRQDEELRRDDAYARDLALGLQRDIGSLTRDFAGLSGKAAADAGAEAKARILALESAALDQASNPRMRTMLENLSAGPLAQALDLVASHSRRGLRQMGGQAARGERDLAIEGALAAPADPAAMAQARRQVIEANARLAEAEEWDEARFGEENARTLSDMHTRMVRAVLDNGGDIDLAGAYFEANRDEMAVRDITLTEAALRGPRELADTARVVDEAIAAGTIEAGDTDAPFDLAGTIRHIKARTDLSEAQRQNALAQARKRHSVEQAALSDKHEAGRKAFDLWAEQASFDRELYVQDAEVPDNIRSQLSPAARAALDQLRTENRVRMERELAMPEDGSGHQGNQSEIQNLAMIRPASPPPPLQPVGKDATGNLIDETPAGSSLFIREIWAPDALGNRGKLLERTTGTTRVQYNGDIITTTDPRCPNNVCQVGGGGHAAEGVAFQTQTIQPSDKPTDTIDIPMISLNNADPSKVISTLSSLDKDILEFIKNTDIKFAVVDSGVAEYLPDLAGTLTFDQTRLWDDVPALYHPGSQTVVIATGHSQGLDSGSLNTILHELGHAIDFAMARKFDMRGRDGQPLERASQSIEFVMAYQDADTGTPFSHSTEDYYRTRGITETSDNVIRRGEAFAEAFTAWASRYQTAGSGYYNGGSIIDDRSRLKSYFDLTPWKNNRYRIK